MSVALLDLACTLDNVSTEMKSGLLVLVLCATLTQAGHRRLDTSHVSAPGTRRGHVSRLGTCVRVLSVGVGGASVAHLQIKVMTLLQNSAVKSPSLRW